ncbi:TetR/AcrR family transcriptional regulator [Limosilactobacillus sp.]|uniref:TetR/AcrR family transcriptional regulator n=1 Tax=Limosilactobacillus sp. TaxID=2773925 RepID=UPI003F0BAC82
MAKKETHAQRAIKRECCKLLSNNSLDKIYVRTICQKAGYSTMAFYAHYTDKYDLGRQIIQDEARQIAIANVTLSREIMSNPDQQPDKVYFQKIAKQLIDRAQSNQLLYSCIFNNKLASNGIADFSEYYDQTLHQQHILANGTANDTFNDFFTCQTIIMLMNAVKYWQDKGCPIPAAKLASLYSNSTGIWLGSIKKAGQLNNVEINF